MVKHKLLYITAIALAVLVALVSSGTELQMLFNGYLGVSAFNRLEAILKFASIILGIVLCAQVLRTAIDKIFSTPPSLMFLATVTMSVVILLVNYKNEVGVLLLGYLPMDDKIVEAKIVAGLKLLALTIGMVLVIHILREPFRNLLEKLQTDKNPVKLALELEEAQDYASEILRRLIRSLPLEALLLAVAGVDRKHIHSYDDKTKYKTIGFLMLFIGAYTLVAIYYLIGEIGSPLLNTSEIFDTPTKSFSYWTNVINKIVIQYPLIIGLIFSVFIVSIDRLIISDHSLDYRLFKIRLQKWANNETQSAADLNTTKNIIENRQVRRLDTKRWHFWKWRFLSWYWMRGKALRLPLAAENFTQWSLDAAALFHPRAFLSALIIVGLRIFFVYYTSILVSNAIMLKIYEKDIKSIMVDLIVEFEAKISNCDNLSKNTLGCNRINVHNELEVAKSNEEIFRKAATDESKDTGTQYIYCRYTIKNDKNMLIVKSYQINIDKSRGLGRDIQGICDNDEKFKNDLDLKNGPYVRINAESTTGRRSVSKKDSISQDGFKERANIEASKATSLKANLDKLDGLIVAAINDYRSGIDIRLKALETIKSKAVDEKNSTDKGKSQEKATVLTPVSGNPKITNVNDSDGKGKSENQAAATLATALRWLLMVFEISPVILLKVVPLLGWMPSMYIWSYCVERIKNEKKFGKNLTSQPWPYAKLPDFEGYQQEQSILTDDHNKNHMESLDSADLVVGLLSSLGLPIVVVAAIAFGIFTILKPLAAFMGLTPDN